MVVSLWILLCSFCVRNGSSFPVSFYIRKLSSTCAVHLSRGGASHAMKVLKVSKCGLIAVESYPAQQCSGQEVEELAHSGRVCEFLSPFQVVLSLQHRKSGLSPGDCDSLGSKQNRRVRFAIPPLLQALLEVSVSLSGVKMCLACSESCSVMG